MKRRARSLLAAATGAAVLLGGAGLPAAAATRHAQHAYHAAPDFTGDVRAGAYVPAYGEVEATVTLGLKDPATVRSVTGTITPPGRGARPVTFTTKDGTVTGTWRISTNDPAGTWKLAVSVTREAARSNAFTVTVAARQAITDASVTPDPVKLLTGRDVKVSVQAAVKGAATVSARLVGDGGAQYYDLGELARESGGRYHGFTYFGDNTVPGEWTLEVYASRGGETIRSLVPFTVRPPAGGVSRKAKVRITVGAPKKVAKGKSFKLHGKVYRDGKPYAGKKVKIYFKAKGATTYRLVASARAGSSGKYARTLRATRDGYFQVRSSGTARTRAALSPQRLVDVR